MARGHVGHWHDPFNMPYVMLGGAVSPSGGPAWPIVLVGLGWAAARLRWSEPGPGRADPTGPNLHL
jgi:hypothetical protein